MKFLRLIVLLACLPVVGTIVAVPPSGDQAVWGPTPAAAKPIECRSMSSSPSGPVVVSGCNHLGMTGGSGTQSSCDPTGTCPLIWSTGKETNFTISQSTPSISRCPFPLAEVDFVGQVVSTSGPWTKRFIGAPVAFDVCFAQQINVVLVELVPGTRFTIG